MQFGKHLAVIMRPALLPITLLVIKNFGTPRMRIIPTLPFLVLAILPITMMLPLLLRQLRFLVSQLMTGSMMGEPPRRFKLGVSIGILLVEFQVTIWILIRLQEFFQIRMFRSQAQPYKIRPSLLQALIQAPILVTTRLRIRAPLKPRLIKGPLVLLEPWFTMGLLPLPKLSLLREA